MDGRSKYEKFLDWVHKDEIGDPQVIFGGELTATACLSLCGYSKTQYIVGGLFWWIWSALLVTGVCLLTYGVYLKIKKNRGRDSKD